MQICTQSWSVAGPEILKGGGERQCISPVIIIYLNAHNELYAVYMRKDGLLKKKYAANKGEAIPLPLSLLNPPLHMM